MFGLLIHKRHLYSIYAVAIIFLSCQSPIQPKKGAYLWQFEPEVWQESQVVWDSVGMEKLYLHVLDIGWVEGAAVPVGKWTDSKNLPHAASQVPVVFITNEVMKTANQAALEKLTEQMLQFINDIEGLEYQELQIDCDWTSSSETVFFSFLKMLKTHSLMKCKSLSITIRLHQLGKSFPIAVDRGMLMCYNMGELSYGEGNSILDVDILKTYLQKYKPPTLPLDVALPLFKWGAVFRDKQLVYLINGLDEAQLQQNTKALKLDGLFYEISEDQYLNSYLLNRGDEIRLESVSAKDLRLSVELLQNWLPRETRTWAVYYWDKSLVTNEVLRIAFE